MTARKHIRAILLIICKIINFIFGALGILYGAATLIEKKYAGIIPGPDYNKKIINFFINYGWLPVLAWLILKPLISWLESKVCPPFKEKIIKSLVNKLFTDTKPEDAHDGNYRVTLYKYRKFSFRVLLNRKFPWGEWLCPYERSGFQRLTSKNRWKVSLNKPSLNKGVAGACFAQEDPIYLSQLPGTSEFRGQGGRGHKKLYAQKTNIDYEIVKNRVQTEPDYQWPRSFWGIRIISKGKPWGVLLIDSTLPEIDNNEYTKKLVSNFLDSIDLVLST